SIPKALENVIIRALAKEPRDRFASADQFIIALQKTGVATGGAIDWYEGEVTDVTEDWDLATRRVARTSAEEATRVHGLEREEKVTKKREGPSPKRRRARTFLFLFVIAFLGGLFWAISYLPQLIFPAEV